MENSVRNPCRSKRKEDLGAQMGAEESPRGAPELERGQFIAEFMQRVWSQGEKDIMP